jgi:hypothetical protein
MALCFLPAYGWRSIILLNGATEESNLRFKVLDALYSYLTIYAASSSCLGGDKQDYRPVGPQICFLMKKYAQDTKALLACYLGYFSGYL